MCDQLDEQQNGAPTVTPRSPSPSPSALSTASSASPLIRTNSSSSSIYTGATAADQPGSAPAASGRNQVKPSSWSKRPAPTSIAAAQLQQQQLSITGADNVVPLAAAATATKAATNKLQSCNKLALMTSTRVQQQAVLGAQLANQHPLASGKQRRAMHEQQQQQDLKPSDEKKKKKTANDGAKGFGYNYAKLIAYKASRFNEFWSVNKMRYMNLACLLMTLVCLFTILLFSKTTTTNQLDQLHRQESNNFNGKPGSSTTRRRLDGGGDNEQDTGDDTRNPSSESIESIDRQPFVRLLSSYKRHSPTNSATSSGSSNGDDLNKDENRNAAATNSDGFNLFDDRHDGDNGAVNHQSSSSSSSFDDLLEDARRQLRLQQKNEREIEESTPATTSTTSPSSSVPTIKGHHRHNHNMRPATASIDPILGQVFDDLDNFGLFKAIKAQLFDGAANFTQSKPIVRRSKNGATIIMSFSGTRIAPLNNSTPIADSSNSSAAEAAQSLFDKLLPPMLRPPVGPLGSLLAAASEAVDGQSSSSAPVGKSSPAGFATITINAEPLIRGPFMSSSSSLMNPFGSSLSLSSSPYPAFISKSSSPFSHLFGAPPPHLAAGHSSLVNPFVNMMAQPPSLFSSSPSSSSLSSSSLGFDRNGPGSGLLSMILRASSDLADQIQQLDGQQAAVASNSKAANSSMISAQTGSNSSTATSGQDALNSQASQVVSSKQAAILAPDTKNETVSAVSNSSINSNSTASSAPTTEQPSDQEVETFDVGQLMSSSSSSSFPTAERRRQHHPFGFSPMRSIYSSMKRPADSMIMISSSSSSPGSIFQAPDSAMLASSPFALPPLPSFVFPQSMDSAGPTAPHMMSMVGGPQMLLVGGSGPSRDRSSQPMSPMLRAMLGGIMSSLSEKGTSNNNDRDAQSSSSSSQASRRGDESEFSSSSSSSPDAGDEWEERDSPAASKLRPFNHQMVSSVDNDMDGQSNEGLDMPPVVAFSTAPGASGASSLFEHMLESSSSLASNGAGQLGRVSGTIKQIFRSPGVTVERIIGLPTSLHQQQHLRPFDSSSALDLSGADGGVQFVDRGVKSQSISRVDMDQSSSAATNDNLHHHHHKPSGSLQMQPTGFEDGLDEQIRSMIAPSSPAAGSLIGRLFNDLRRHDHHQLDSNSQLISSSSSKNQQQHRQQRAFDRSSFDGDDSDRDDEQQDQSSAIETNDGSNRHSSRHSWSPKIRLASSARVRFSPRADSPVPSRFTMPAEPPTSKELSHLSVATQMNNRRNSNNDNIDHIRIASSFTTPNSPLFGFPAMKSASSSAAAATHHQQDSDRARSSETTSAQVVRSAHRPFVYHSNHEVAGGQQGRSNEQQQQQLAIGAGGGGGLPAAVGMGRRLDEDELIGRIE